MCKLLKEEHCSFRLLLCSYRAGARQQSKGEKALAGSRSFLLCCRNVCESIFQPSLKFFMRHWSHGLNMEFIFSF